MSVWDESPLPPPRGGSQPATDVPGPATVGSGGADGGNAPPTPPAPGGRAPDPGNDRTRSRRLAGVPVWLLATAAVVAVVVVVAALIMSSDDGPSETATDRPGAPSPTLSPPPAATPAPAAVITSPPEPTAPATTGPVVTSTAPATSTPEPTAPTTTALPTTIPTTIPTPTTIPATTIPATTAAPSEVTASGATTVVDQGRSLTVTPRRERCRSGSDCLVVAFAIDGFTNRPDEFVCEFSSGQRYTYRFSGTSVETACSTIDVPDSIIVEVDGLRSDPIMNGN